jgi:sugar-specific transcriptional regulator TrmB
MEATDIIKGLESLGFTNYESKVFCTLFEGHSMTATEIAKDARIPRSSAYDILKSFTEKGICNEILTSSVARYELIDPKVVEDKIEKEIHDTYKTRISRLKESFQALQPKFKAKELEARKTDVELIKGYNKHRYEKFLELMRESNLEILYMNKLGGYVQSDADQALTDFCQRGGAIRSIYEVSKNLKVSFEGKWKEVTPEDLMRLVANFAQQGEIIRLADSISQIMAIFDRKVVYIGLVDPNIPQYNRSDIIVKNEYFAKSMIDYFESCWEKSYTADEYKTKLQKN